MNSLAITSLARHDTHSSSKQSGYSTVGLPAFLELEETFSDMASRNPSTAALLVAGLTAQRTCGQSQGYTAAPVNARDAKTTASGRSDRASASMRLSAARPLPPPA